MRTSVISFLSVQRNWHFNFGLLAKEAKGDKNMRKKKRRDKKVYRTNIDTVSLNVEQFGAGRAPFCPGLASWEKSMDPRRLRKKGSQICH